MIINILGYEIETELKTEILEGEQESKFIEENLTIVEPVSEELQKVICEYINDSDVTVCFNLKRIGIYTLYILKDSKQKILMI